MTTYGYTVMLIRQNVMSNEKQSKMYFPIDWDIFFIYIT